MKFSHLPVSALCAGLVLSSVSGTVVAQQDDMKMLNELYKSRAEAILAESQNKQANAALINAHANYLKSHAEAQKLYQDAREKSANNDLLETKVFYEKRGHYHAYKEAHRSQPSTPEQYAARAARAAPERLSGSQIWMKPGVLRWPSMLQQPVYDGTRGQIDGLFASRSPDDSGAGSQNCVDIQTQIRQFKYELVSHLDRYRAADYLAAKRFLESVAMEAQNSVDGLAPNDSRLASR